MPLDYATLVREDRVHGSLYVEPLVFADEMERIFRRGWVFVGHESEVPRPGDWVTRRIGLDPVILTRDGQGTLHVLANRCAHRGNALCWQASGHGNGFRCTYHGWTFGIDGALRTVSSRGGFDGDRADFALGRAGAMETHRGFVFANMSGTAGPLSAHLGAGGTELIDRLCDLSPTGRLRLDAGWIGHRIESNWKMWPESDNDGYHLDFVHESLFKSTSDSYYKDTVIGGENANVSRAVDRGEGHGELDLRPSYKKELAWLGVGPERVPEYRAALIARLGKERAERVLWDGPPHGFIFPNLFLGEGNVARVEPAGLEGTVHHHTALQFEGADEAFNRRLLRQSEAGLGPASFIVPDDAVTAERMQSSMRGARLAGASDANDRTWVDVGRGRNRETVDAEGQRAGHITDEVTNRAFWRHYRHVMESRA